MVLDHKISNLLSFIKKQPISTSDVMYDTEASKLV